MRRGRLITAQNMSKKNIIGWNILYVIKDTACCLQSPSMDL